MAEYHCNSGALSHKVERKHTVDLFRQIRQKTPPWVQKFPSPKRKQEECTRNKSPKDDTQISYVMVCFLIRPFLSYPWTILVGLQELTHWERIESYARSCTMGWGWTILLVWAYKADVSATSTAASFGCCHSTVFVTRDVENCRAWSPCRLWWSLCELSFASRNEAFEASHIQSPSSCISPDFEDLLAIRKAADEAFVFAMGTEVARACLGLA